MAHKIGILERHCAELGRDPASIVHSAQAFVRMSDRDQELRRWREHPLQAPSTIGPPAEIADTIGRYAESGLDEFIVSDLTLGVDSSERRDTMDRFMSAVATHR